MEHLLPLFVGTFTTLLAVVNPLEALPVFLSLAKNKDAKVLRKLAFRSCFYALILIISFLVFGTLILQIFGVNLAMVRIVGGIILMKIGFDLFMPSSQGGILNNSSTDGGNSDPAFVPLALPIMFGPGVLATVLGMTTMKTAGKEILSVIVIAFAAIACMLVIFLTLAYAQKIVRRIGEKGIDATTRIVGFFVATMGMGLIFHGLVEFLQTYRVAIP
ncbi:MAG: MarC family protein [Bacteroidales bacterium]|nr:MarC family protein [Bacteroidales bacterium]